jgi:hypothetical protein
MRLTGTITNTVFLITPRAHEQQAIGLKWEKQTLT